MRIDALITATRLSAQLSTSDDDYTDARLRQELTDTMQSVFGHAVIKAKAGAWLKKLSVTTAAGQTRYRIPHRAAVGLGDSCTLNDSRPLPAYQIIGDEVVFDAAPSTGTTLEWVYYLRPSLLVEEQASAGRVTAVSTSALTVTVASVPTNRVTASAVVTGDTVDIVHANGWHELSVVNVAATLSGSVFTFPAGTDLAAVEVGDFLRAADQTDWPCIPDDYHRALCDLAGARVLRSKGYEGKASALERQALLDVQRLADALQPRIKKEIEVIRPRFGVFGRSRRRGVATDTFG